MTQPDPFPGKVHISEPSSPVQIPPEPAETRFLKWALLGGEGLRVGWSVALFLTLVLLFWLILSLAAGLFWPNFLDAKPTELTVGTAIIQELVQVLGLLGAGAICVVVFKQRCQVAGKVYSGISLCQRHHQTPAIKTDQNLS